MSIIIPANTLAVGGFNVANSVRLDGIDSSSRMEYTASNASNRRTWTWSAWIKRSDKRTNNFQVLFSSTPTGPAERIMFEGDKLTYDHDKAGTDFSVSTPGVLRDFSAWYHVVVMKDTTQSTETNRIKIYVNGVQQTLVEVQEGFPGQNLESTINTAAETQLFAQGDGEEFGGYACEVVFCDGQSLAADSFGEFDSDSGIWKPIDVSGLTFGTHGFYLDFEASGNLGNDANGGTDLGETNLAATDQSTDTCTNNFATMLPLTKSTDATLSEGNLNVTYGTASTRRAIFGSIVVTAGKWFCETKVIATSQTSVEMNLGISNTYNPEAIGNALISANGFTVSLFPSNGSLYIGSTRDEQGLGNLAVNDIIGMAINIDDGTLQFYKNGSALGSANDITTGDSDDGELYPGFTIANSCSSGGQTFTASHNFGSPAYSESGGNSDASGFGNFSMSVPSGFFSICTKNLAEYG